MTYRILPQLLIYALALALAGCQFSSGSTEEAIDQVKEADRSFSRLSSEQGMSKAFIEYADESVIKLNNGQFATVGKAELEKAMTAEEFDGKLTWEPLVARVDHGLGYTFGDWKMEFRMNEKDTVIYGNYVTIWRRQPDGKWKFVLDGGNPTPGPTPAEMVKRINVLK